MPLDVKVMRGTLPRGGTVLGSSRTNPFKVDGGVDAVQADARRRRGSTRSSPSAARTRSAWPTSSTARVSVSSACRRRSTTTCRRTELTFGFDTAVQIATDAIDRLHTTAESHDRVMVCEVMGRHAGHIATVVGHRRRGARMILIPEEPFDIEAVCDADPPPTRAKGATRRSSWSPRGRCRRRARWRSCRGEVDQFGHVRLGGIGQRSLAEIEARTGYETRVTILGHVQRGGTPTAFDRVLVDPVRHRRHRRRARRRVRQMVALQGGRDRAGAALTRRSAASRPSTLPCTTASPRSSSGSPPRD